MKYSDYHCRVCGNIFEVWIENKDNFPASSECPLCHNTETQRRFSPLPHICHQGRAGNQKNGYTSNEVSIKKT